MGKRLYIQLYNAKTGESITLPLNPESTDIPNEKDVKTYNILGYGEVSVRGNKQLKRINLTNILPDDTSYFSLLASLVRALEYKQYSSQETIEMINRWLDNDDVIRVIISGYLNAEFTIERHISQIRETTPDVGYNIDLIEYRNPEKEETQYTPEESKLTKLKKRAINKFVPNQEVAQKGMTIYKLAKLTYGDKFIELADKNGISNLNMDITGKIIEMLPV